MDGRDQPTLAEYHGRPAHSQIGHAVFRGEVSLAGQSRTGVQFSGRDTRRDVVGQSDIHQLGALRVECRNALAIIHRSTVERT
ncbi:hypothetical protein BIV57_00620 [Mangrovactinospora gilvigrisea]|uniref:Uncharacterized protein n=1 Tax=Mangrovactinospora gilvigrisea TaxID=1428644 RepID=A0A1J7BLC0_9ACTN|nr:hypothetical protein BIV57_00620 [Mangrovactinospora gilvigrisea]